MKQTNLNKYVDSVICGKFDLTANTGRGMGDDYDNKTTKIKIHGYEKSEMASVEKKTYSFGFTINDNDICTNKAVVRFSNKAYYGESVKSILADLVKSKKISRQKVNDLMCYLVMKFSDSASEINSWVPDELKCKEK